ncbi:MAG: hypothetical protein ACI4ED_05705 [Suilimivivens sp.]
MALEGCLVFPVFLLFLATLLYSLEMVRFQSDVYEAMHQVGSEACFYAYESLYGKAEIALGNREDDEIKLYLDEQFLPYLCAEGGSEGVQVTVTQDSHGKGNIEINTSYSMKPFIRWLPIGNIRIQDNFFGHGFVGYTGDGTWAEEEEKEVYVYITPTGSKYHFSEECTYLKIKIEASPAEAVTSLRNGSGEKYYPCEYCDPKGNGLVYFTEWGNRYHGKSDCPSLKRTVYIIPISEVGERTACSKCG